MKSLSVELENISKFFGDIPALQNVSLKAYAGECLGLMGENGAGKSTLMKILSGVWPHGSFSGQIKIEGRSKSFSGPQQAADAGLAIIHQELSLFDEMSVAENIFMMDLPSKGGLFQKKDLYRDAEALMKRLNFHVPVDALVKSLSVGQRQLVEIARAFTRPVKILIFDEPTSALSDREIEILFSVIRDLKKQNVACIYISHKLPEIRELCERVSVLRDGRNAGSFDDNRWSDADLIEGMVGRKIENIFPPKRPFKTDRTTLLEVRDLTYQVSPSQKPVLDHIDFDLKEGEILGIAGLMGSRRTELVSALFGALKVPKISGKILMSGNEIEIETPQDAIRNGFGLVTEDRKLTGLVLEMDVRENMTLPILRKISKYFSIQAVRESELVDYYSKILRIKAASQTLKVRHLSGGNQQKVILGRWLSIQPKILMLDEPTRGIDVYAKSEIYFLMRQLVDQGLTLIVVSSELPEIVSMSDRVLVMREGKLAGILDGDSVSQQKIMEKIAA